jgi:hypothetical protein
MHEGRSVRHPTCYRLRSVSRLNRAQRIVAVIGLGVALWFVGGYVTTLGNPFGVTGWIAYAPLSNTFGPTGYVLDSPERLLVWLGLVIAWIVGSAFLLRTAARGRTTERERSSR